MKNLLASVTFFVFIMFLFSNSSLAQEKKAPDFSLKSVDGKIIKLSDYKNKVVIIDFWATWCPPCRRGIPDLIALQKEFKKDLVVLGISLDTDTKGDVPAFVKDYGINYPIVYGDNTTAKLFGGVSGIPTSFLIDKKGNIVDKHVGLVPKETLAAGIKNLLKK
ncbi:MAG: TlpA disulfide reductase family protein [Ignavibacteriaceae bacterium]|jgi:cytochrome c biogenesis protein CcmG/thiol:disulfide interchange protein DsbE